MSTWTVDAPLDATVSLARGRVDVTATDTGSATATVTALDPKDGKAAELAARATVELSGTSLVVKLPNGWRGGNAAVLVTLQLPPLSSLRVDAGNADVVVDGHLRDVAANMGKGELRAASVEGAVSVHAGSATVLVGAAGSVALECGSGRLTAESVRDVTVKAGSADTELGATSGAVVVKGGRMQLAVREASTGSVRFESGAGGARVGVRPGTTVALDLSSVRGDVRCDLPVESAAPAGGAALSLHLRTGSGDLLVARA